MCAVSKWLNERDLLFRLTGINEQYRIENSVIVLMEYRDLMEGTAAGDAPGIRHRRMPQIRPDRRIVI